MVVVGFVALFCSAFLLGYGVWYKKELGMIDVGRSDYVSTVSLKLVD